jgi:hypothetical protein
MAHEAAAAVKAIRALLSTDTTMISLVGTKIFSEVADRDAVEPYIVIRQRTSGNDERSFSARVATCPLYDVGIWVEDKPASATAQSGAKRIDVLLDTGTEHSVTDANGDSWKVIATREGGAWVRQEVDPDTLRKFFWVGGSYRVDVWAA